MIDTPRSIAPELTEERLQALATLLVTVRGEVIDRHEPELGDTRLSLGMRAYECCRSRIIRQDSEGTWPWLSILTYEGRFTLAVDGIPVRFSRNDPDHLPDRKLVPSDESLRQIALFEDEREHADLRWFLVIDTPYDAPAEGVYIVGYTEFNEIVCKREIPLGDVVPALGAVNDNKPQAVDIAPAPVSVKSTSTKPEEK